jgi:serine/threonine protein kinase
LRGDIFIKGNPRRGGIASVYRALDSCEERTVAVKVFRASFERDDVVEESFRRETRALSDLRHPNIIEILDSGVDEDSGEHFIVME